MIKNGIIAIVFFLFQLVINPLSSIGQEPDVEVFMTIQSFFTIHNASNRLQFPHCPPADTVMVTEEPYLITINSNISPVTLEFACASPKGDLVYSLLKQEFLNTWYIITLEDEPAPDPDDPRWISGKQLLGYLYPILSTGTTYIRIFSKVRLELPDLGLYRDMWTILAFAGEYSATISMIVDCEVAN